MGKHHQCEIATFLKLLKVKSDFNKYNSKLPHLLAVTLHVVQELTVNQFVNVRILFIYMVLKKTSPESL